MWAIVNLLMSGTVGEKSSSIELSWVKVIQHKVQIHPVESSIKLKVIQ